MAAAARPRSGGGEPPSTDGPELARRLHAFTRELDHVYRTLRRFGVGPTDAEDLAQEVFLIAWRRWAHFDDTRPLRPWLVGIAFKVARDHQRRQVPEVLREAEPQPSYPVELEPDALDARALVLQGLAKLPERHRTVLILHELDGLSVDDIAAQWSVPRFTLYTRLRRARLAFAREIERLQRAARAGRPATAAAPMPAQMLALEREIPPAPPALHDRVIERLRAEATFAAPEAPPPSLLAGAAARLVAVGLGIGAVSLGLTLLLSRDRGSRSGWSRTEASTARSRTVPPARSRPLTPVRLRAAATEASSLRPAPALLPGLRRGLVGFWRFDDGPGSTRAADGSAGGHHCDLHGLDPARAWIPGAVGGAIELGLNGWLECPQPDLPRRQTAAFSVAVWVKRAGHPAMHRAIAMRPMGGKRGNYFFFGFVGDTLKVHSSGWSGVLQVPFRDPPGRWVHVAFTHGVDKTIKLFVSGLEVGRRAPKPRVFSPVQGPLRVGAGLNGLYRDGIGQRFEGALDELLVYERALSAGEIAALARVTPPRGRRRGPAR